ncbi:MAG: DUF5713 family protein [Verrucomicrobiota bacterium]
MRVYPFLEAMYRDHWFPNPVVDQGRTILVELCQEIERQKPAGLKELYVLTEAAVERFNDLEEVFEANDSEIETVGREIIGDNFWDIAMGYGFEDADSEELISGRNW